MDETFAEARPSLAMALENLNVRGFEPRALRIGLEERPARVVDYIERLAGEGRPVVLVASPLLASALLMATEPGRTGDVGPSSEPHGLDAMPLIVPEWYRAPFPGITLIDTDPLPAYRAAGRACGAYIAAIKAESGGAPSCGLVYTYSPSHPRSVIEAFASSYRAVSGAAPLLVRELPSAAPQDGPDMDSDARAAVEELLGSDMRVLFVAAGGSTLAALKAAPNPGLVLGAELSDPASPPFLAFRIVPNDKGLARAVGTAAERWNRDAEQRDSGKKAEKGDEAPILLPALLLEGPAASYHAAGSPPFALFLRREPISKVGRF